MRLSFLHSLTSIFLLTFSFLIFFLSSSHSLIEAQFNWNGIYPNTYQSTEYVSSNDDYLNLYYRAQEYQQLIEFYSQVGQYYIIYPDPINNCAFLANNGTYAHLNNQSNTLLGSGSLAQTGAILELYWSGGSANVLCLSSNNTNCVSVLGNSSDLLTYSDSLGSYTFPRGTLVIALRSWYQSLPFFFPAFSSSNVGGWADHMLPFGSTVRSDPYIHLSAFSLFPLCFQLCS